MYPITATPTRCCPNYAWSPLHTSLARPSAVERTTPALRTIHLTLNDTHTHSDFVCIWFGIIFLLSFFWKNNVGK